MKAVQTKSGRWRARYVERYEVVDGKRKIKLGSVTADTEREAVKQALVREKVSRCPADMTVESAVEKYIELKTPVLSPTTIRSYTSVAKNAYDDIAALSFSHLTAAVLQAWVNKYSSEHTPKATANAHGLLRAALSMFAPDVSFRVSLPKRNPPELYTPTEAEVAKLIEISKKNPKLYKALILASYGLRRGEICALTYGDVDRKKNTVYVNKNMVRSGKNGWVIKPPKTPQSIRHVVLAPNAVKALTGDAMDAGELIIGYHPDALTNAFKRLRNASGLPQFRFHDLRSFSASLQHSIGIPEQYILKSHGWKSNRVLMQTYRRTMTDKENEYNKKVCKKMYTILNSKGNKG